MSLNFAEILLEQLAFVVYSKPTVKQYIEKRWSQTNLRQLLALLQSVCVAFGIFGIRYFLGAEGIGDYLVRRIW